MHTTRPNPFDSLRSARPGRPSSGVHRAELLDLEFDAVTMEGAISRCIQWCEGPRTPHVVVTANSAILCMMRHDPELAAACRAGDLVVADGMSVVWALKAAGTPVPERVTGVDLMAGLLERGSQKNLRVYFLGARAEVVAELARQCERRYPGIVIAGLRDGYFEPSEHAAIVEAIREARPHLLFVGMQSPFKEVWCQRHRDRLDVPVIMGVGGSFDVHAGFVKRAPTLLQSIGMEWSWRLMMEPGKMWKRYGKTNFEFIWRGGRQSIARRLGFEAPNRTQNARC